MGERGAQASGSIAPARAAPVIGSLGELWGYIREDHAVHAASRREIAVLSPGFLALALYRVGVWANGLPRLPRAVVRRIVAVPAYFVRNAFGVSLYATASIGRRLKIVNHSGVIVHPWAVIGDDCLIRQGVTIGFAGDRGHDSVPRLGDRVSLGAGAVIAGAARIGDDVQIAPNVVVMANVPAGSIVAPPPARIMAPPPRKAPAGPDAAAPHLRRVQ